jgi:hypothetical protein
LLNEPSSKTLKAGSLLPGWANDAKKKEKQDITSNVILKHMVFSSVHQRYTKKYDYCKVGKAQKAKIYSCTLLF